MTNRKIFAYLLVFFNLVSFLAFKSLAYGFTDVSSKIKQYEAISALENEGVISGFPDGTFHPDESITRSQLLKMVFSHIGFKPEQKSTQTKFIDVPADSWFAPYVKKALDLGSINYNSDNPKFYPEQPLTKIEALKMVLPLEGIPAPYINDKTPLGYSDIKNDSSYAYLVRAAKNAHLFNSNKNEKNFSAFKILTRAEAAELLYNAELYRENGSPFSENNFNSLSQSELDIVNNPKFPVFVSVWNKINQKYYNQEQIDKNELIYGAIQGMVSNLGDQYSVFESPLKAGALQDSLEGKFDGIGTVVEQKSGDFIIVNILDQSPASKSGLKINDIIKKIDDKDVKGMNLEKVVNMIKGSAGTKVKLTVIRDGKTLEFNLIRESLKLNSLYKYPNTSIIPNDIGYIAIHQFTSTTADEFNKILKKTLEDNPKGLILDLRDNPGGYLDTAYKVMGHFIPKGQSVMKLKINGQLIDQKSDGEGELNKLPLVILVNKYTASAAEVMAGAIQDYKTGKLLGEQTYGKGTVQEVTTFNDGSLLKLSIANWLTPLNRTIDKIGLTPDYPTEINPADEAKNIDTQIAKAVELLNTK